METVPVRDHPADMTCTFRVGSVGTEATPPIAIEDGKKQYSEFQGARIHFPTMQSINSKPLNDPFLRCIFFVNG